MPDVREVYDMVTQQTPPKPDALERQRKRQMRHTMNRRLGGFAAAAAVIGLAVFLTVRASGGGSGQPGEGTTVPSVAPSVTTPGRTVWAISTAPWVRGTAKPDSDYLIDVDTGEMTPLPQAIIDSLGPAMTEGRYAASPDGSTLAFVGVGDGYGLQILLAGVDGSGIRQATHDLVGADAPAWSPDGTKIAYVGSHPPGRGDRKGIFVLDVATGQATLVIEGPGPGSSPTFTPDGASIVYTGGSNSRPLLRVVPIGGGESRILIGPGEGINDTGNGTISPDGSLVTFLGSGTPASGDVPHCGPCRIIANADGTDRRVVPGWMAVPAGMWSPDSSRIVVMEGGDGLSSQVMVVDAETEEATIVANGEWAIWVDDDTLLVQV